MKTCRRCGGDGVLRRGGVATVCPLCRGTGQMPGAHLTDPTPEELRWSPIMAGRVGRSVEASIRLAWWALWSWRDWPWRGIARVVGLVAAAEAFLWGLTALLEPFAR